MNSYLNGSEFWIEKSSMFILTFFSCLLGTFNISEERRKLTSNAVWQTLKMGLHISDLCLLEPSKSTIKTSLSQAVRSRTSSAIFWKIGVQWQVITAWQELTLTISRSFKDMELRKHLIFKLIPAKEQAWLRHFFQFHHSVLVSVLVVHFFVIPGMRLMSFIADTCLLLTCLSLEVLMKQSGLFIRTGTHGFWISFNQI